VAHKHLLQVFWMKNGDIGGQPDRFFVTADTPLSIAGDFLEFGGDMTRLRRRLKAMDGVRLHDGFPEYGKDFRRRLGIESEQAMELFHQTVSMKSVGNLTEFVREHMLEPFNVAQATRDIVTHFDHLTSAHEAVLRAHAQLDALTPLLKDCDAHDAVAAEIATLTAQRAAVRYYFADHKARLLDGLLTELDSERSRLTARRRQLDERLAGLRARETSLTVERAGHGGLDAQAAEVNAELRSLRERRNNIPKRQLDLRALLCQDLGLAEDGLPFAGELIAVRPEESDWEGAAERLLRSFALSILVPDEHYRAVSGWIDGQHLRERVVYYRVPAPALASRAAPPEPGRGTLAAKLEVKDTDFAPWLERELASRADAECVQTMAEFRRATRAVTKAGQIKGGFRREKDDRFRIDDRSRYVLGWSNERKIDVLLGRAAALARQLADTERDAAGHEAAVKAAVARGQVLAGLAQTRDFAEIDYQAAVNRIAELTEEHARLTAASAELTRLDADLEDIRRQIAAPG